MSTVNQPKNCRGGLNDEAVEPADVRPRRIGNCVTHIPKCCRTRGAHLLEIFVGVTYIARAEELPSVARYRRSHQPTNLDAGFPLRIDSYAHLHLSDDLLTVARVAEGGSLTHTHAFGWEHLLAPCPARRWSSRMPRRAGKPWERARPRDLEE